MNTFNCVPDTFSTDKLPFYSDKSILPQEILESLLSSYGHDNLPSPLIFTVSNRRTNLTTYIGVKEFTAQPNIIILPGVIQEKLKVSGENSQIELQVRFIDNVPKGESLALKALNPASSENIFNLKFFLEANLSINYTTLTENDILSISNTLNNKNETFDFLVSKTVPGPTICIINTDLTFDLEPMDDEDAEKLLNYKQNLLNGRESGPSRKKASTNDSVIDLNQNVADFKIQRLDLKDRLTIPFEPHIMYHLPLENIANENSRYQINFSVKSNTNQENDLANFDLLVSNDRFIAVDSFIWSTVNSLLIDEQKSLAISGDNKYLINKDSIYFVGNLWSESGANFEIELFIEEKRESSAITNVQEESMTENETICKNCGKKVNKNNLFLHENFCLRNNIKCPKGCGQVFLKHIPDTHWHCDKCSNQLQYGNDLSSYTKHQRLNHDPVEEQLNILLPAFGSFLEMALYKATIWENKLHECKFCHLVLPKGKSDAEDLILNLSHHENIVCGSKTTDCFKCGKIVKYKDLESHLKIHDLNRLTKNKTVNYVKCLNINCINVLKLPNSVLPSDEKLNERLGLCNHCFGQFYSSAYDPDFKKLGSRFERRYMIQLTRGCGFGFCKNKDCLSSGLCEKKPVKETFTYVKNELMSTIPNLKNPNDTFELLPYTKYSFCVNELITKKKLLVDHYYDSIFGENYQYYWICMAVNELSSKSDDVQDLQKVETWLKDHAVTTEEMQSW